MAEWRRALPFASQEMGHDGHDDQDDDAREAEMPVHLAAGEYSEADDKQDEEQEWDGGWDTDRPGRYVPIPSVELWREEVRGADLVFRGLAVRRGSVDLELALVGHWDHPAMEKGTGRVKDLLF